MYKELQIFSKAPTWQAAGEWVVATGHEEGVQNEIDIPAFVIWSEMVYASLRQKGVANEIPAEMVSWMVDHMDKDVPSKEHAYAHPAFSKLFPVPEMPPSITPKWEPFRIIETYDPNQKIVVQPLTLVPVSAPKVMITRRIDSELTPIIPPKTDPFLMATVNAKGEVTSDRGEIIRQKIIVSKFWKNISKAGEILAVLKSTPSIGRAEAINAYEGVKVQASDLLKDLVRSISIYAGNLNQPGKDFPLSDFSKAAIMWPWVKVAGNAWMHPIRILADAGNIELPKSASK